MSYKLPFNPENKPAKQKACRNKHGQNKILLLLDDMKAAPT